MQGKPSSKKKFENEEILFMKNIMDKKNVVKVNDITKTFGVSTNYLEVMQIYHSIPQQWKIM